MKSTSDLLLIAGLGVNLIIDASTKSTSDLILIANVIGRKGTHLTIKNCNKKSTSDLIVICRVYPSNITLDLSE